MSAEPNILTLFERDLSDHKEQLKQIRKNSHENNNSISKLNDATLLLKKSVDETYDLVYEAFQRIKKLELLHDKEEIEKKTRAQLWRSLPYYAALIFVGITIAQQINIGKVLETLAKFH